VPSPFSGFNLKTESPDFTPNQDQTGQLMQDQQSANPQQPPNPMGLASQKASSKPGRKSKKTGSVLNPNFTPNLNMNMGINMSNNNTSSHIPPANNLAPSNIKPLFPNGPYTSNLQMPYQFGQHVGNANLTNPYQQQQQQQPMQNSVPNSDKKNAK